MSIGDHLRELRNRLFISAIGVERLLDLVEQAGGLGEGDAPDVYLISSGDGTILFRQSLLPLYG